MHGTGTGFAGMGMVKNMYGQKYPQVTHAVH
jgi:hypothetical protein